MADASTSDARGLAERRPQARERNVQAVFEWIASAPSTSRTAISRALGLSPTVVGRLVDDLLRTGLIAEGPRIGQGVGRPHTTIHLAAGAALVAGVSIRSSTLWIHVADLNGTLLAQARHERDDASVSSLSQQVATCMTEILGQTPVAAPLVAVVIGISGVWSRAERRVHAVPNLRVLAGTDALASFSRALAGIATSHAIDLENDVNLALIGEHATGAARGVDDVFYVNLGAGVGGAGMVAGTVQQGTRGFAGEIGYLPIHVDDHSGTLESLLAREPLERYARERGIELAEAIRVTAQGPGDTGAEEVLTFVGRVLGQALAAVATTLDPRLVVLGGGVGGLIGPRWTARVKQELDAYVPTAPEIVNTGIGREAPLIGAVVRARAMARRVLVDRALAERHSVVAP